MITGGLGCGMVLMGAGLGVRGRVARALTDKMSRPGAPGGPTMSIGELAGLIAALAFVLLVGFLAYPLSKLGKVFDETRLSVHDLSGGALPLLSEVTTTVSTANDQLVRVDTITRNVAETTENVSALTRLFAATLGSPVVKVAAFSYGVRQVLTDRRDRRVGRSVRRGRR